MRIIFSVLLFGLIVTSSYPTAANAQFAAMNAIRIDVNMGGFTKQALDDARASDNPKPKPNLKLLLPSLKYTTSLAVRKKNLANFVEKTRQTDPNGADELAQTFSKIDVIDTVGKGIAQYGLRTDNLGDAYAVYWANAWLGSRGRSDDFDKTQILAVRDQAANALVATPAVLSASNAQKQEMAEALLVQAALIGSAVESAKSDAGLMSKVKAAIAQGAKGMGIDLYSMTLSDKGFIPAKRGSNLDQSDIPSALNDESLASNTPTDSAPNYALIAAAGGAGLGGIFLLGKAMGRKN